MLRPPFFWTPRAPIPIRTATSSASRSSIRSSRRRSCGCSARTASWSSTRCCWRWPPSAATCSSQARMRPAVAATLAGAFVMASVVPVYYVWIAPELFNFTLGAGRVLLLALQGGGRARAGAASARDGCSGLAATSWPRCCSESRRSRRFRTRCCFRRSSCGMLWRRRWRRAVAASVAFGVVAVGLFAVNMAISGEWNYQGGQDRSTFVYEFPLQTPTSGFDVGAPKERNEALTEIIFNRSVFWTNLTHNLRYMFVGRYAGIVPYFFPAAFAILALPRRAAPAARCGNGWCCAAVLRSRSSSASSRRTRGWAAAVRSATAISWARTGCSCSCCRRSPASAWRSCRGSWVGSSSRRWCSIRSSTSFYPGSYAAHGPFRMLPVELTLVYDWPINTDESRGARVVRRQRGPARSRISDLLLRCQRVWQGAGQELLGEGRVARRVPDQDRSTDETPGPDGHRRRAERRGSSRYPATRSTSRSPPAHRSSCFSRLAQGSRIRASGRCGRRRSRAAPDSSPRSTSHRARILDTWAYV